MSFQLSVTSFVIKILCKFSQKIQHCNNCMWHLWLKNSYLQLKKLVVNMQIPCIEITPGTIIFLKLDFFKTYEVYWLFLFNAMWCMEMVEVFINIIQLLFESVSASMNVNWQGFFPNLNSKRHVLRLLLCAIPHPPN